jgi:hypothetical protein
LFTAVQDAEETGSKAAPGMHFAEYIIFVNMKMIYLRWSILLFTLAMSLTSVEANPPLNPLPELFIKKGCTLQTSKKRDHFNFSLDFSDLVKSYSRKTSRDPLLSRLSGAPGQTDYTSPYRIKHQQPVQIPVPYSFPYPLLLVSSRPASLFSKA